MSWLVSLILAGSLFSVGNVPLAENHLYEYQNTQSISQLDETERFEQIYPLNPDGRVSVSNVNGSITVEAWDKNQVKLEVIKKADSRETLAEVEIKINSDPEGFEVETDYGNWNRRGNQKWDKYRRTIEVQYNLLVPAGAFLDEIETVNGSVTLKNMTNYSKASAVNGAVSGINLRGTADLSTVNGAVSAEFDQLQGNSIISLDTVNGSAKLIIPSDANATVRAETVNGSISNDFGLPVRKGKYVGRDLYGRIGTGDTKIKLESVNGGLSITHPNDGKRQSPAVDLLPPKTADDDDFDDDFNIIFETNVREAQRALREARREAREVRRNVEQSVDATRVEALRALRANAAVQPAPEALEAMRAAIASVEPEITRINEEALRRATNSIEQAEAQAVRDREAFLARAAAVRIQGMRSPFLEEESDSFEVTGTPTVRVETLNCPISVRGWDRPEVKYSMTKVATRRNQAPVDFRAERKDDRHIEIKVLNKQAGSPGSAGDQMQVRLEVFVPKKSNLRLITNDEIRLEGVSGDIELEGQNGEVNVRDVDGTLNVKSIDGLVRVIGFNGDLMTDTANARLFLEGDFRNICATAKDSMFVLTLPEETNADITANTDSIMAEGIKLIRKEVDSEKEANFWRIGEGGRKFNFNMEQGVVIFRSLKNLS